MSSSSSQNSREFVSTVLRLIGENELARGKMNKKLITLQLFDYIVENAWFLSKYQEVATKILSKLDIFYNEDNYSYEEYEKYYSLFYNACKDATWISSLKTIQPPPAEHNESCYWFVEPVDDDPVMLDQEKDSKEKPKDSNSFSNAIINSSSALEKVSSDLSDKSFNLLSNSSISHKDQLVHKSNMNTNEPGLAFPLSTKDSISNLVTRNISDPCTLTASSASLEPCAPQNQRFSCIIL